MVGGDTHAVPVRSEETRRILLSFALPNYCVARLPTYFRICSTFVRVLSLATRG